MKKLIVIAGAGEYPRLLVQGAKRAGVETVDVMAVKGSCERATARAADHVFPFAVGESEVAIRWTAGHGYDGAVLAGQVSPLSLCVKPPAICNFGFTSCSQPTTCSKASSTSFDLYIVFVFVFVSQPFSAGSVYKEGAGV